MHISNVLYQDLGCVLGVSKQCCLVCIQLLAYLQNELPSKEFVVEGSHKMFTTCTLPPWLPEGTLKKMVHIFAVQIELAFLKLLSNMQSPLCGRRSADIFQVLDHSSSWMQSCGQRQRQRQKKKVEANKKAKIEKEMEKMEKQNAKVEKQNARMEKQKATQQSKPT